MNCFEGTFSALDLNTATVRGILRWSHVVRTDSTRLDLRNASVGSIDDDEASWPAKTCLTLDGFTYARISNGPMSAESRLRWLDRMDRFTAQPYRYLAKSLRDTGDDAGARRVLYELEDRRRKGTNRKSYRRCWDWVLKRTIGYGQRSEWALLWLLGLTLLGSTLFGCGYLGGGMVPSDKDAYLRFEQEGTPTPYYPRFNALAYSFEHAFPLVNFGMKDHWEPNPSDAQRVPVVQWRAFRTMSNVTFRGYYVFRLCVPGLLHYWLWFQILAGWVLATLFVAGLTGIVKSGP